MTAEKKQPAPVLVAVFPSEGPARAAVAALEEKGVGLDFIGLRLGAMPINGYAALEDGGPSEASLLSVLAPRRLTEDVRSVLAAHGASLIDEHHAVSPIYGSVPHPGTLEDHDLKMPMGLEFPDNKVRRPEAVSEAVPESAPVAEAMG